MSSLVYSFAIAWFTYHMFWMAMRIYQFNAFPRNFGVKPDLSLKDLGEAAIATDTDIPAFNIVVPAYQEVEVIEGTLRRLAAMNYPRTHFKIYVVTYEDEPVIEGAESTYQVAKRVAEEINSSAHFQLVNPLLTPAGFDGFFPGDLNAKTRHIGKARGLNFAIRGIHETNERDERSYYIGKMYRNGQLERADQAFSKLSDSLQHPDTFHLLSEQLFSPESKDFIGPLTLSSQLRTALKLAVEIGAREDMDQGVRQRIVNYISREAPRFFLELEVDSEPGSHPSELKLIPMADKEFLSLVMTSVEQRSTSALEEYSISREHELASRQPLLQKALQETTDGEEIYQLSRKLNSRWMMVYDADADAPVDILRYLAARILTDPDVMGFQGPVAPLLNYDDVHPLCRMGGLWMGFWHGAAYPRLLHKKYWAHPLAGTNWCFLIEGFEHDGKLVRNCPYEEKRRRFLLSFDPRQLTEDLEVGIRNFSEWSVNAEWHPVVEMEQVPPTPGAMFVQHSRWALGTLQTMPYIMKSKLRWTQKVWFSLYPLRVVFASSGPFITAALIIAILLNALIIDPVFAWWTLLLAFGNLVYYWAFSRTFERYYDMRQHAAAVDAIYAQGQDLIDELNSYRETRKPVDLKTTAKALKQLKKGEKPRGFIAEHLMTRCLDDEIPHHDLAVQKYFRGLRAETPTCIQASTIHDFIHEFEASYKQAKAHIDTLPADRKKKALHPVTDELNQFNMLINNATCRAGANRRPRWSRYHTQILLWSIPYIYFSVTPFYRAFWRWLKGERVVWHKTVRTPKG